jgi:hypothetical protein
MMLHSIAKRSSSTCHRIFYTTVNSSSTQHHPSHSSSIKHSSSISRCRHSSGNRPQLSALLLCLGC